MRALRAGSSCLLLLLLVAGSGGCVFWVTGEWKDEN